MRSSKKNMKEDHTQTARLKRTDGQLDGQPDRHPPAQEAGPQSLVLTGQVRVCCREHTCQQLCDGHPVCFTAALSHTPQCHHSVTTVSRLPKHDHTVTTISPVPNMKPPCQHKQCPTQILLWFYFKLSHANVDNMNFATTAA